MDIADFSRDQLSLVCKGEKGGRLREKLEVESGPPVTVCLTRPPAGIIFADMKTTLKSNGHIVIPRKVRREGKLRAGDELEILVDEDEPNVIILRRRQKTPNEGLAALLRACPIKGFRIPKRSREMPRDFTL